MLAEIIAIGTELTTGAKLDTNSQWLSIELAAVGIPVRFHTTMADDLPAMVEAFRAAVKRSDLVLITGGLGPTLDDLTRQALAELAGVDLVLHEPSLAFIRDMFARRNRPMPERNLIQAMFPAGSEPIGNPRGTAPGIWMAVAREGGGVCLIAAMPGVPSEMTRMFRHEVLPRLPAGGSVIRRARVHCFGVGESHAEQLLGDLTARGRDPDIGITVHEATITLRITAQAGTAAECEEKIATARHAIRVCLGELVFGEEEDELEHVVVRLLNERGLTLSTAEAGTGGLLAHRLTDVAGFERSYLGGIVAPTDAAKCESLGVAAELLREAGPVCTAVAAAMAEGCRNRFGSDFALAITECPRFDPDDPHAAAPAAYVALAGEGIAEVRDVVLLGDPAINKSRTAKTALNLLRLHLNGRPMTRS
jgi:nicotinamide-nucleotide amidase